MNKFEVISKSENKNIKLPTRADDNSAGYDIYLPYDIVIEPGQLKKINTHIKCQINPFTYLQIVPRSSIGIKRQLMLANTVGVIDASYYNNPDNEGEIIIALYNYGSQGQELLAGERIAQGIFTPFSITEDDKPLSHERLGGIGSTGR